MSAGSNFDRRDHPMYKNIYFFNASLLQGGGSRFILVRQISLHIIDNFECVVSNCRYRA